MYSLSECHINFTELSSELYLYKNYTVEFSISLEIF